MVALFNDESRQAVGDARGAATLISGTAFCISSANGDIEPGGIEGLFVRDTRFCSRLRVIINGVTTQPLALVNPEPFVQTFVSRVRPTLALADPALLVVRNRYIGDGMREDITIRNLAGEIADVELTLELGADFASLFEVKVDQVRARGFHSVEATSAGVVFAFRDEGRSRRLTVSIPPGADIGPGLISRALKIGPREEWTGSLGFEVELDGQPLEPRHRPGQPVAISDATKWLREWREEVPRVRVGNDAFALALSRGEDDLGALRIFDPDFPDEAIIAAGAPWYLALFGRDSLISAWMMLGVSPGLAEGTLRTLARQQGTIVDPENEEQPGKILHELRFRLAGPNEGPRATAYFGSIDATPLFVMLLGEARRWGLPREVAAELLPNADRAIAWIEEFGDIDGDGFVEYARLDPRSLSNQGWKDSPDGVNFISGELARAPIALCEVQGYVYAAYVARYHLALDQGDAKTALRSASRAAALRAAFNRDFWIDDLGYFAVGLDADKKPIDALVSNIGHLLWTGIVDDEHAAAVARHLVGPDLFTGWGVRTLAASMSCYNPMSYHNGSVWPHDSAIAAAGLMRYGFVEEAQKIALGLIAASEAFEGQLPELFCGFDRSEFPEPIAYPTACAPQAWASAAPHLLLRTLLRLDPIVEAGCVYYSPVLPPGIDGVRIDRVPLAGARLTAEVNSTRATLGPMPAGMRLIAAPAPARWPLDGARDPLPSGTEPPAAH